MPPGVLLWCTMCLRAPGLLTTSPDSRITAAQVAALECRGALAHLRAWHARHPQELFHFRRQEGTQAAAGRLALAFGGSA